MWERILVEAAVIGGKERWIRRLDGYEKELLLDRDGLKDPEGPEAARIRRDLDTLASLRAFALPLLDDLEALPRRATWGEWQERLGALARRALGDHERVSALLGELKPMADVGPVDLLEVRVVLEPRLTEIVVPPSARPAGRLFVGAPEEARGLAFEVVFVPGLAEKLFPRKVNEDPIFGDLARREVETRKLVVNEARAASERLALRLAVGAATKKVVLSYPRDRPRAVAPTDTVLLCPRGDSRRRGVAPRL